MTEKDILELCAGPAMDKLIAEKFLDWDEMGVTYARGLDVPGRPALCGRPPGMTAHLAVADWSWSYNWLHLADLVREQNIHITIASGSHHQGGAWHVEFDCVGVCKPDYFGAWGTTIAEAFCRAALLLCLHQGKFALKEESSCLASSPAT